MIKSPDFGLYEPVTVHWDGVTHYCTVIDAFYSLHDDKWYYELDNFKNPHDPRGWFESISIEKR